MAIPDKDDFNDYYLLLSGLTTCDVLYGESPNKSLTSSEAEQKIHDLLIKNSYPLAQLFIEPSYEKYLQFFQRLADRIDEIDKIKKNHKVNKWLEKQDGYRLALRILKQGSLDLPKGEWIEHHIKNVQQLCEELSNDEQIIVMYESYKKHLEAHNKLYSYEFMKKKCFHTYDEFKNYVNSFEGRTNSAKSYIRKLADGNPNWWLIEFIKDLQWYFYTPHNSEKCIEDRFEEDIDKRDVIKAIDVLKDYANSDEDAFSREICREYEKISPVLQSIKYELEAAVSFEEVGALNLRKSKKDDRWKERSFIRRLWTSLENVDTRPVKVIMHLICIEGFQHQYDQRSVERLLAQWKSQQNNIKQEKRKLASKYPDASVTSEFLMQEDL